MSTKDTTAERRVPDRVPLQGEVVVEFPNTTIVGPGQNISSAGVFFVASATLRVSIKIEGHERELAGELVRIESMGHGQLGIAIRFVDPDPTDARPSPRD